MNHFVFNKSLKSSLFAMMATGILSMAIIWVGDDSYHTRFWSNFLHDASFFTGIAALALFFYSVNITAWSGWHTTFKRVWEAMSSFLYIGFILMVFLALAVYFGWNHLYHWADQNSVVHDEVLKGKSGFLNKNWYLFGTIIILGIWAFFYSKLRGLSVSEDIDGPGDNFAKHRRMRFWAAIFLPILGYSSAAIIWQWIMSVDAHWYSTLFAWYAGASWFVTMIAMTILLLIYLKSKGYFDVVTADHIHDLGKFLFGFSIFWTYLWFSQFMLIWYANIGEETIYFKERYDKYPVLFFANIFINFVIPFFILMRNDTKRKFGSVGLVAIIVILGHWLDFFLMIKPGVLHTAHELMGHGGHEVGHAMNHGAEHASTFLPGFALPGLLDIGAMVGFLGLFLYVFFHTLSKSALVPKNDPYIEESLHHHVV